MGYNAYLKKILKFQNNPLFSQVKDIIEDIHHYEKEYSEVIIKSQRGKRVEIINKDAFFLYVSERVGFEIKSFKQIKEILKSTSKKENISLTTNSKSTQVSPFNKTILLRKKGELTKLYQKKDLKNLSISKLVAIENSESFLEIDKIWNYFEYDYFLYLSGNPNSLIREFIQDKEVLFFIDLDIVSLNFYEDINVAKKMLFIPKNFEELLKKYGNRNLYLKQRKFLRKSYNKEIEKIIVLIQKEAKVLEQEIISYDTFRID